MGYLDWMKNGQRKTAGPKNVEESIHNALLKMSCVVGAMGRADIKHPSWHKYIGDFNKAVSDMQTALGTYEKQRKQRGFSHER